LGKGEGIQGYYRDRFPHAQAEIKIDRGKLAIREKYRRVGMKKVDIQRRTTTL